jgi:hypothetical protein
MLHSSTGTKLSLREPTPDFETIVASLKSQNAADYLPADYENDLELVKGFETQKSLIADVFL